MYSETLGSMTVNGVSVRSGVPTKVPYNMGLATVVFAPAAEFAYDKTVETTVATSSELGLTTIRNDAVVDFRMRMTTSYAELGETCVDATFAFPAALCPLQKNDNQWYNLSRKDET